MGSSPRPTDVASASEANAYLELVKRKPPANIDGLLTLISDIRHNEQYSEPERQRLAQLSEPGRILASAVRKCEGLRRQCEQRVAAYGAGNGGPSGNRNNDKAVARQHRMAIQEATHKYMDCLTYHSCTPQWKAYTQCWTGIVSDLSMTELKELQAAASQGFVATCQQERHCLERCIGNLVASTVQSLHHHDSHDIGIGWERRMDPMR